MSASRKPRKNYSPAEKAARRRTREEVLTAATGRGQTATIKLVRAMFACSFRPRRGGRGGASLKRKERP
jgi:hypothetical protein